MSRLRTAPLLEGVVMSGRIIASLLLGYISLHFVGCQDRQAKQAVAVAAADGKPNGKTDDKSTDKDKPFKKTSPVAPAVPEIPALPVVKNKKPVEQWNFQDIQDHLAANRKEPDGSYEIHFVIRPPDSATG